MIAKHSLKFSKKLFSPQSTIVTSPSYISNGLFCILKDYFIVDLTGQTVDTERTILSNALSRKNGFKVTIERISDGEIRSVFALNTPAWSPVTFYNTNIVKQLGNCTYTLFQDIECKYRTYIKEDFIDLFKLTTLLGKDFPQFLMPSTINEDLILHCFPAGSLSITEEEAIKDIKKSDSSIKFKHDRFDDVDL